MKTCTGSGGVLNEKVVGKKELMIKPLFLPREN